MAAYLAALAPVEGFDLDFVSAYYQLGMMPSGLLLPQYSCALVLPERRSGRVGGRPDNGLPIHAGLHPAGTVNPINESV